MCTSRQQNKPFADSFSCFSQKLQMELDAKGRIGARFADYYGISRMLRCRLGLHCIGVCRCCPVCALQCGRIAFGSYSIERKVYSSHLVLLLLLLSCLWSYRNLMEVYEPETGHFSHILLQIHTCALGSIRFWSFARTPPGLGNSHRSVLVRCAIGRVFACLSSTLLIQ